MVSHPHVACFETGTLTIDLLTTLDALMMLISCFSRRLCNYYEECQGLGTLSFSSLFSDVSSDEIINISKM